MRYAQHYNTNLNTTVALRYAQHYLQALKNRATQHPEPQGPLTAGAAEVTLRATNR